MRTEVADYAISAVRYEGRGYYRRIASVMVHDDYGITVSQPVVRTRQEMIRVLRLGYSIRTVEIVNGYVRGGAMIHIVTINGNDYIRTDANSVDEDNLGNLPEF